MASAAASLGSPTRRPYAARFVPAEGWTTVLLHAIVVLTAAWTVDRGDLVIGLPTLAAVAVGGAGFGLLLAKVRVPDLLAHLLAMVVGGAVVVWAASDVINGGRGGRRDRLRLLWGQAEEWYDRTWEGKAADDVVLFGAVMAITLWLVAYTSAWVLYRRGWLPTALVLPGIVIVINLGYAAEGGTAPLLVYVLAACVLAARHYAFRREREWRRAGMPTPAALPWRFLRAGATLAVVAALLGWTLPLSARSAVVDAAWDRVDSPLRTVERWWERWLDDLDGPGSDGRGTYSVFGESFDLGGPLDLGDDPVLRLEGTEADYLAAHRYDRYNGHGWSSDVEQTFDPYNEAGERYSPQMTFRRDQEVPLSAQVTEARQRETGRITTLQSQDDILFTLGSYVKSDQATSVQLSWRRLDDVTFDLTGDIRTVPTDLRQLAALVQAARFSSGTSSPGEVPAAIAEAAREAIAEERRSLEQRFLSTSWDVGPEGMATTLHVSGQIPVYDDVEAVFAEQELGAGAVYQVTGAVSRATPGQLREAGAAYPGYVRDRYLQLPTTVTDETRTLAAELAAGTDNPFDTAVAIQDYLRGAIEYDEGIAAPPSGRDVVDYVLFESERGYCEYYASAMVVMLRMLDIPARMAVGYAPAREVDPQGGFVYRERNAHAWVEAFFPDYGWIPFEPTRSQPPLVYGAGEDATGPAPTPTPEPAPTPTAVAAQPPAAQPTPTPPAMPVVPEEPSTLDRVPEPLAWASALTGLALVAGVIAFVMAWRWGLRGLSPAGSLYARALKAGRWLGVRPEPTTTPAEYAELLGRSIPAAREPARAVANLYVAERFGARAPSPATSDAGQNGWRRLRGVFARSLLRRRRGRGARRGWRG